MGLSTRTKRAVAPVVGGIPLHRKETACRMTTSQTTRSGGDSLSPVAWSYPLKTVCFCSVSMRASVADC